MKRVCLKVFLSLIALTCYIACSRQADLPIVSIKTQSGTHTFKVEIADTLAERRQGLMERTDLKTHQGMLFVFPNLASSSFWMKNTPTSLDIIFIGEDQRVLDVATNTVPFSETRIIPEQAYRYVLEVLAGTAARIKLQVGDQVRLPLHQNHLEDNS